MARAGLTPARVVAEAAQLADEGGLDRLTLAAVAQRLGVALPSLYKHVRGLDDLHRLLAIRALDELSDHLSEATVGRSGSIALQHLASAYRTYASNHPGSYAATLRSAASSDDTAYLAASDRAVRIVYAVLAGYGLTADQLVDATRSLRSALHGFVSLEAAGGFGLPQDVDRSYERLISVLDQAFAAWPQAQRD
ncbi:TetR/AcrR family transcriptional regulator [Micromonospora polyrhachis]|uniref:AcrR family transcriptional regulator n=1 Tax=Micromonospora polyrhachis TaxID=1282883 RepID=A0A7W7WPE8_9ACTN|nr:TetR/AcrR family transcriptional regulator [Micromonospora polyrhachis]MBB4959161.1 AcrR family transcriptional regulator [Micromonospora polyrhachis]